MEMQFDAIDKRTETWAVKIPLCLKTKLDQVSEVEKKKMTWEILQLMARYVHNSTFDPIEYLRSE